VADGQPQQHAGQPVAFLHPAGGADARGAGAAGCADPDPHPCGRRNAEPETITVLDPACGSSHILVVAYHVLKAIYLERGYHRRAIARLILEKNLYGLDSDDRAAQMAGFALLMKARTDELREVRRLAGQREYRHGTWGR